MIESIMLANGLIICYLVVSGRLSNKERQNSIITKRAGICIFLLFFIIISLFFYLENFEAIRLIAWSTTIVVSIALIVRLYQIVYKSSAS